MVMNELYLIRDHPCSLAQCNNDTQTGCMGAFVSIWEMWDPTPADHLLHERSYLGDWPIQFVELACVWWQGLAFL